MSNNLPPARERIEQAAQVIHRLGSVQAAARELNIPRKTLNYWIENAPKWYDGLTIEKPAWKYGAAPTSPAPSVALPSFPDDDIPAEQILDHMAARFEKRLAHDQALKWFEVKVNDPLPIGVNFFGDPHLGDNGCNVPLLRRDVNLVKATPGLYAANMGDTVNNWGGRLIRLYAEQDSSRATERRLARWFLNESGVPWLFWLFGNHDEMHSAFTGHLRDVNAAQIPMIDWRARFKLVFPNGQEIKIDAAHNHKGTSIWNELHGQERASLLDETAHLFIAGHHHNWGIKQKELPDGIVTTLVRARGYKWLDDFATHHGFHNYQCGASICVVFDPLAKSPAGLVRAFADAEEGADYLTWKRKRAA